MDLIKISSRNNELIRMVKRLQRKKYRDQTRLFYIEGMRIVEDALATDLIHCLFFSPRLSRSARGKRLLSRAGKGGFPIYECTEHVLAELTDTVTSQGVLAVLKKPNWTFSPHGVLLIADQIRDPGNMGTFLRTAVGAGVSGLLVVEGSVDLFNPKVVRASMGAVFNLPHWFFSRQKVLAIMQEKQIPLVVADLIDAVDYFDVYYPSDLALVIGNEAQGVNSQFRQNAALRVKIPLKGPIESLNASVAAGVLLYEILRQHRSV